MEFAELISRRESVRSYDPARPVDRAVLERVLEAGRIAPSAANRQPWRFLLVSSPEMLAKARQSYAAGWFQEAPHLLAVTGSRREAWTRRIDGWNALETDLAIAMDHLILAATNEGLGTCWVAAFSPDVLRKALGLSDDEEVLAVTPLGYPKADYRRRGTRDRKPLNEVARFL